MAGQQCVFAQMSRPFFCFETATSALEFIDTFFVERLSRARAPKRYIVRRAKIAARIRTIFDYFGGNLSVTVKGSVTPVTRAFRIQTNLFWNATGHADEA
jgi:hypothetical protein